MLSGKLVCLAGLFVLCDQQRRLYINYMDIIFHVLTDKNNLCVLYFVLIILNSIHCIMLHACMH